ncbi:hypothetical protein [Spongiactinospora sp. TRM90649]|uniref:hypothetical protein n=1 Tax=Spongiactinospora sp. TRM90649 TaxID=3031114 RepID=UPI0023F6D964|nr:hypothetical protein [Spongiactinospora sp. TRM90649]MDF5756302.1 hypothetical protein [Spongiactinospora sp. TRM90649]
MNLQHHRVAGPAAVAGGLAAVATGVIQAIRPQDTDPRVIGQEHLVLSLFAVSLLLVIPGLLALAAHGGPAARPVAWAISAAHVLLAFGATSSNLNGEDFSWFFYVAGSANAVMLIGAIPMAVSLWRAGRLPRPLAAALPVLWIFEIPLSQLGGGIVVGAYWILAGLALLSGSREPVT